MRRKNQRRTRQERDHAEREGLGALFRLFFASRDMLILMGYLELQRVDKPMPRYIPEGAKSPGVPMKIAGRTSLL